MSAAISARVGGATPCSSQPRLAASSAGVAFQNVAGVQPSTLAPMPASFTAFCAKSATSLPAQDLAEQMLQWLGRIDEAHAKDSLAHRFPANRSRR